MSMLTSADLRHELQLFAEITIKKQLSEFSTAIHASMCNELQRIIPLQASQFSQAAMPQTLRETGHAELCLLPGQVSHIQTSSGITNSDLLEKAVIADDEAVRVDQTVENYCVSEDCYEAAKGKASLLREAVATEPGMAQQLRELGYFRRCYSHHTNLGSKEQLVQTTKQTMLQMTESSNDNLIVSSQSSLHIEELDRRVQTDRIARVVDSDYFEYCVMCIILANALFIGIILEVTAGNPSAANSPEVRVIEIIFFILFAIEVGLRIFVYRCWFFRAWTPSGTRNPDVVWNLTDLLIVVFNFMELILEDVSDEVVFDKVSVVRLCRIMRIVRLVRVAKLLQVLKSMRVMVSAMFSSLGPFVCGFISLQIITYVFAVYFTEITSAHHDQVQDEDAELRKYFGSLSSSWMSLLQAVSGGIDWGDLSSCLRNIGSIALVPFLVYLFFILLALMNVFTGIFFEHASQCAKHETEIQLLRSAHTIFKASDSNDDDIITEEEFQQSLEASAVQNFFDAINFDIQQAEILFDLLDTTHDSTVSCNEFLRGCLRLGGTAKALDLLILSREVHQLIDGLAEIVKGNALSHSMNHKSIKQLTITSQDSHRMLEELMQSHRPISGRPQTPMDSPHSPFALR